MEREHRPVHVHICNAEFFQALWLQNGRPLNKPGHYSPMEIEEIRSFNTEDYRQHLLAQARKVPEATI